MEYLLASFDQRLQSVELSQARSSPALFKPYGGEVLKEEIQAAVSHEILTKTE